MNSSDCMVIFAHPDDAEFGMAGTISRWCLQGKKVVYVSCTSGEKGTTNRDIMPEKLAEIRESEQRAAAELLGVSKVEFLRLPDQGLEDTPEVRKQIVRMIRMYCPETVATSDPYRRYVWHRDHRIIGQVTLDAVFPYARDHLAYPELLAEGLEPHKVRELFFWGAENPNYLSDITETFHKKYAALLCHRTQVKELHMPDLEQRLRDKSRKMAQGENFELGEALYRLELPR